ncbi:fused MFS/spermidine synthase [Hoyosella rhizosphaerae]|uniref:Spermidine synthase n=1 Tax=Hoyosella rhizosphaerae TaxID=1755582 RepID=A0A916UGZ3_9ACTN|nr:fused MFS/spermidine synthase [Hoyosella rhizosphaerae]MBN4928223.1 fused MFS/spermidine synthase [Hoyosella rhizosphaerae]GGC73358.1 spermidine synthase [Hoyosella rhizosphaerae]
MTRQSRRTGSRTASLAGGAHAIDTGTCELVQDGTGGWLVNINGVPSSHIPSPHIALDDLRALEFGYMRWAASAILCRWSEKSEMLRVLHLGGGACTLPRYVGEAFPAARQVVVEIDGEVARLAREWSDLPRAPRLRIRVGDAREVVAQLQAATRDVIIRDVFAGDETPAALCTTEFLGDVRRVLVPGGMYIANCGSVRGLRAAREDCARTVEQFEHVLVVAEQATVKGRRPGNVVLVASDSPLDAVALAAKVRGGASTAVVLEGDGVRGFCG